MPRLPKRSRRRDELIPHVEELLDFLSPIFSEWDLDAAKGIGWGLKTLARYYPDVVTPWLIEQITKPQLRYRAVILRKATTYLPDDQKNLVMDQVS